MCCSAPLPTPQVVKVGEDANSCRSDYLYAGDIVILQHPVCCARNNKTVATTGGRVQSFGELHLSRPLLTTT